MGTGVSSPDLGFVQTLCVVVRGPRGVEKRPRRRPKHRMRRARLWRRAEQQRLSAGPAFVFEDLWGAGRHYRPDLTSLDLIEEMRRDWD